MRRCLFRNKIMYYLIVFIFILQQHYEQFQSNVVIVYNIIPQQINNKLMKNHVFKINDQPGIIYQAPRKLIWLSLPALSSLSTYYTKSNYVQTIGPGSLIAIDKNCVNFLTTNFPPLSLSLFKQDFFDWQPSGGICLSSTLILYHKHKINFYQKAQNLKKSWTIQVMQQISQIKSSPQEKVIGMTVKQKQNTIFLWNLHDISNKPFQEVTVSQPIVKWQFISKDMLAILTLKQFQIYFPNDGNYNLQFFIEMAHIAVDFCFFDRPKTNQHTGRRTSYPLSILSTQGKVFVYQLYDIDKRIKNSLANILTIIETGQDIKQIICGYQNENSQIVICGQLSNGKPVSIVLNSQFIEIKRYKFLPEFKTGNPQLIQYCKQIACTEDQQTNSKGEIVKKYKLYRNIEKDKFQFIQQFDCNGFAILGGYNFFCFNKQQLIVYPKAASFKSQAKIIINDIKIPNSLYLLEQREKISYFVSGIKIFRLDYEKKSFVCVGFTIKNERFKLIQVRNQTRSILYKSNQQYLLLQYQVPENFTQQSSKMVLKTIKSSQNYIISLRNQRWLQKLPNKIVVGEGNKTIQEFDIAKFTKFLTQQSAYIQYQVYWTTHDGILLTIKNYLFVLELTQSSDGYSLNLIKRSLNYLHSRFDPDVEDIQVLDARNITIREGARIIRLGNKLGAQISQDPYSLPDTLLRRQLLMRKIYPPHHPKIIQYLIQLGYFQFLESQMVILEKWIHEKGTMANLYEKMGVNFFIQNKQKAKIKTVQTKALTDLEEEPILKRLCQQILQNPHVVNLQQNGSLILQSQIQALIFRQENLRSLDSFSESVITQFKTFQSKNESFKSMHIAYMLHSNNKQEAVNLLKKDNTQLTWQWMKKYSIVMWYGSKTQINSWAQEIGSNLFKVNKQPFDCLFWYTVAGKKNILIQLFKKYTFNSAEHEAMFKFLQRDFTDQKNRNAAIKNAYALIDKKRLLHALAFFIYGQNIDEAVSLCLTKLKDLNLAFLICNNFNDQTNRDKLNNILLNQGDVWTKHVAYFLKNQHIDSFNCLFSEESNENSSKWEYEPKISNFHPCLMQFAEMIEKSVPIKRQLQEQQMKKYNSGSNDIFASFYGGEQEQKVEEQMIQQKKIAPNYKYIEKQSVAYFIRNSCSILALMIQPQNHRAKRAYDLCSFILTKQVNPTVLQLIFEMEDYLSILQTKIKQKQPIKQIIEQFTIKFEQRLYKFWLTSIINAPKTKVGQLMHYSYFAEKMLQMINGYKIVSEELNLKQLQILIQVTKGLIICELQLYDNLEQYAIHLSQILFEIDRNEQNTEKKLQFWQIVKAQYDKIPEPKKNKKQNLYDAFEQSLYKSSYKKPENSPQISNFKLSIDNCIPIFTKKTLVENIIGLIYQKSQKNYTQIITILKKIKNQLSLVLKKWSEQNSEQQLIRQLNQMFVQGVVSKLKLTFLPNYLNDKFQGYCRGMIVFRSKIKKVSFQKDRFKRTIQKIDKLQVVQIFRNKQQGLKAITINKNQGQGMQIAILTKRGVKKLQICQSLVNRNRSQDGISLIHEDTFYNMESQFNYQSMFNNVQMPFIQKFLTQVAQNRKQYDGLGILKGSAKRATPQYLKFLDPVPFVESGDINCIQCHHFLPIYMLGSKSAIQLCLFSTNNNYNRIKCPNFSDIIKIRSYQQRVTVLDKDGNFGSFSFDSKITGNCVFSLKKANIIDFCPMTPTTYGFCSANSIQVIDSLLHPKRQVVFKTQTNQAPIAVDYFNQTKLAVCRKNDVLIYDTRMDVQIEARDLGGKSKCMISNYKNKILVGKNDNKVRVLDVAGVGTESDYDVRCISNFRGNQNIQKTSIEDIQLMGKFVVALNSEGSISMFKI